MRDNAPIGNTCSSIDKIIDLMTEAQNEADYISKNPNEDSSDEACNIIGCLSDAISYMENIRFDNQTLRDWGNELHNEREDISNELEILKGEKEALEIELSDLQDKIKDLEIE